MPAERLSMRRIREVLRLKHELGLSHRAVAKACSLGLGTVTLYLQRAAEADLGWPLPAELDDAGLEAQLFPRDAGHRTRVAPSCTETHLELKRDGVTLRLLWEEYLGIYPEGYRYSQFCEIYRRWAKKLRPSMRQTHRAGEKTFVDFSGKRPHIVDRRTGEQTPVELFVAVLGASSFTYAEATENQRLPSWVDAHMRMVDYFGGSSEIWVPDQLKSGVTRACRYEPGINRTYEDLAAHYDAVVIPARPRTPKDKAKVETAVLVTQRWILARLRDQIFYSIAELNQAIWKLLEELNDRPMQKLGASRRELYERLDKSALKPQPIQRYELGEWKTCTVNIDYHIEVDHHYYSVFHQLRGEEIEARSTSSIVEIIYKGKRIDSHKRRYDRGGYSTKPEHMPRSHRAHAEWTPSRLIGWASKTGPATGRLVEEILRSRPHPEQGYRSCLGIMRLGKRHGVQRLEAASRRAEQLRSYSYRTVKNILSSGQDRLPFDDPDTPSTPTPVHANIRGASYYAAKEEETEC